MIGTVEMIETDEVHMDSPEQVPELPVIEFARPMPGFPDDTRFALVRVDDAGTLCALRSLTRDGLRFLVVPPAAFFADYEPVLSADDVDLLALTSAADALVLVVLNPGASLEETSANLVAPIVVNTLTRRAVQIVLADASLPIAAPLAG